ncbi:hypothetical protein [Mesorhizobium sp.]|uniref:hypothetical protein n=1 Tax=Mesorhizobium sp. TaxID=1871066 RepID=UPI000FE8C4A6|nr:hypothetical protein [Mesorhizobium sp.]RWM17953.1 MAG: hypothetical protein EOR74_33030 [Mesorhizobium sp.]RWM30349.1 MAG: hypothetical protein EOR75_31515 [Mesorhizobium sp.]TIO72879.1 MAG: hypothetical protein E5X75_30795 [Mesorhizobium sp.]TIO80793.1 MAG: hypothetical protein E5X74_31615 [Mesorhizobium sp.]
MSNSRNGTPGTTDQKPHWEGPPENRPPGYLPADDDPSENRDAAGENLKNPDKRDLGDALKTKRSKHEPTAPDEDKSG